MIAIYARFINDFILEDLIILRIIVRFYNNILKYYILDKNLSSQTDFNNKCII